MQSVRFSLYFLLLAGAAVFGIAVTGNIIRAQSHFVFREDVEAMTWIQAKTPPSAKFMTPLAVAFQIAVEPFDAGGWISYFTGRQQVAPLGVYHSERFADPDYEKDLKDLVDLQEKMRAPPTLERLKGHGVTHLFYGKRYVSRYGHQLRLPSWYRPVYDRGGVKIFELAPDAVPGQGGTNGARPSPGELPEGPPPSFEE